MKFSLFTLALIPAAFAAPTASNSEDHKLEVALDIASTLANNLIGNIDQLAKLKGLTLEDFVKIPSKVEPPQFQKREETALEIVEKTVQTAVNLIAQAITEFGL